MSPRSVRSRIESPSFPVVMVDPPRRSVFALVTLFLRCPFLGFRLVDVVAPGARPLDLVLCFAVVVCPFALPDFRFFLVFLTFEYLPLVVPARFAAAAASMRFVAAIWAADRFFAMPGNAIGSQECKRFPPNAGESEGAGAAPSGGVWGGSPSRCAVAR